MRENNSESIFLEKVQKTLDESVDNLDGRTLSRLNQARQRALDNAKSRPLRLWRSLRFPMAGLVTASVVIFFAIFLIRDPLVPQYYSGLEDVEILATADTPEFFSELEFYTWLAEEMKDAG